MRQLSDFWRIFKAKGSWRNSYLSWPAYVREVSLPFNSSGSLLKYGKAVQNSTKSSHPRNKFSRKVKSSHLSTQIASIAQASTLFSLQFFLPTLSKIKNWRFNLHSNTSCNTIIRQFGWWSISTSRIRTSPNKRIDHLHNEAQRAIISGRSIR